MHNAKIYNIQPDIDGKNKDLSLEIFILGVCLKEISAEIKIDAIQYSCEQAIKKYGFENVEKAINSFFDGKIGCLHDKNKLDKLVYTLFNKEIKNEL